MDPNLAPESLFRIRIVSGSINHLGFQYKEITGFKDAPESKSLQLEDFYGDASFQSAQAIVQETEIEARLEVAYLLHYNDKKGLSNIHWLHLPYVFRKLQIITRSAACPGDCPPLSSTCYRSSLQLSRQQYRATPDSVDEVQNVLDALRNSSSELILIDSTGIYNIIAGSQRLLLYALLCKTSYNLSPFKRCLTCITSADHREYSFKDYESYTSLFITPTKLQSVLTWVRT